MRQRRSHSEEYLKLLYEHKGYEFIERKTIERESGKRRADFIRCKVHGVVEIKADDCKKAVPCTKCRLEKSIGRKRRTSVTPEERKEIQEKGLFEFLGDTTEEIDY